MAEYSLSPKEASALSCSEIPNSSDSISRQDAIDALDKIFNNIPMELTTEILRLRRELRGLPPADVVQVVHGKWTKLFYDGFNCNKCGSTFVIMQGRNNMYYCPNCGAKMDGGENG